MYNTDEAIVLNQQDIAAYNEAQYGEYVRRALKEAEEEAARPDAVWYSMDEVIAELWARYEVDKAAGRVL